MLKETHSLGLKTTITEDGVWRIRRRERSPVVEVFKQEESGHGDILLPVFVEWRNRAPAGGEQQHKNSVREGA